MRLPDPVIATDKRGERYRLRGRKGRIPTRAVLDGFDGLSIGILVLEGGAGADHRRFGIWVQPFRKTLKFKRRDRTRETEPCRELALLFALHGIALPVVVLRLRGKVQLVVGLRLAGAERFRKCQH